MTYPAHVTDDQVLAAAREVVAEARTPMNKKGCVSTDQVRAKLARRCKGLVQGRDVAFYLAEAFGPSKLGYYTVK